MDLRETKDLSLQEEKRHPWELARLRVVFHYIKKYVEPINNKHCRILDIGCGDTFFIEKLAEKIPHAEFWAIDTAFTEEIITACNKGKNAHRIHLFKNMSDLNLTDNIEFDLVLLLDVLEHIENDLIFLKDLSNQKFIGSNTTLLITVPAFQSLFVARDFFLKHYRRYNNNQIKHLISKTNFGITYISYFFFSLLILRFIQKVKEGITGSKPEKEKGLGSYDGNKIFTKIVESILMLDFHKTRFLELLGLKLPGLSNIIICKKTVS
ncbi:MAG: class I SAM-dependent methyltransferase [Bacteroidales bacterium]|nr:class I SAM-dependent methyltransferase [Bacteroidales bacterium]